MARKKAGFGAENGGEDGRAVAYLRTSSAANLGGDSEPRQREAIQTYAARAGLMMAAEFRDPAVSGADPLDERKGFKELLAWCADTGVLTIIVENASRFARDLVVQETGYALLCDRGFTGSRHRTELDSR